MAITAVDNVRRVFSLGDGVKAQLVQVSAVTGATSGTITPSGISKILHSLLPAQFKQSAAATFADNVGTYTFTVPAETAATLTLGGVTYTAVAGQGASGNSITVAYTSGGTAGSEVVTVVGSAISVQIQSATSTITQVRTAVNASAAAAALVTATGTSGTAVSTATATALSGGINGGAYGDALFIGV